jgi:diguanylate cyclase (GGDEF)-like protein
MRAADRNATVALILIRISGLEIVNDRFGYPGGDKVLEDFVARLRGIAREQDRVFVVNGRTFALLVSNPLHEGHAVLAADRVARSAAEPVFIGTGRAVLKANIGIALLRNPGESAGELLRQSEHALAEARARDERHVLFTPALPGAAGPQTPYAWFDIEEALRAGEFELFYQPKVLLGHRRLVGAEALVRWQKPGVGYVPLAHFMPAIEQSQGVRPLLRFVLNSALRKAAEWSSRCPAFGVAVNLAAGNLEDPDLTELVEDALSVWGLPASQLTLELTESSLMQNPASSMLTMGHLQALGLRTSIDDFGTGYSSLAYLRDLPADELKVDRSFVSRIMAGARDRDIVASIVQLAHAVEMRVVAEGIEEEATLTALTDMGCDIGQGYYFDRPLSAGEFEERWINGKAVLAADAAPAYTGDGVIVCQYPDP